LRGAPGRCREPTYFLWPLPCPCPLCWASSFPLPSWWLTNATHWPWFLKCGSVKLRHPPFLHWPLLVGPPALAAAASKSYVVSVPPTPIVSLSALPAKFVHAAPPHPAARMTPPPPTLTMLASGCAAT